MTAMPRLMAWNLAWRSGHPTPPSPPSSTKAGTLLIVDSQLAAFRYYGSLSLLGADGFADQEAPDVEVFGRSLVAGQLQRAARARCEESRLRARRSSPAPALDASGDGYVRSEGAVALVLQDQLI